MIKRSAVLLLILASMPPALADTVTYDAVADFSVTANPNGQWSYLVNGSLLTLGESVCFGLVGIECWWNGGSIPYSTSISNNITGSPIWENGSVLLPPGILNMDPEANSVMATWTAPSAGDWWVRGFFSGLDFVSPAHPAEVILDSTTIYTTTINHYGEMSRFSFDLPLNAGDVLTFEVDTGNGGYFLSTGFDATISNGGPPPPPPLPAEPASWSLFALGLAGLAAWRFFARG